MEMSTLFFVFIGIVLLVLIIKMVTSDESKKRISSGNIADDVNQQSIDHTALHHHQQVHEQFDQAVHRQQQEQTALSHHQEFNHTVQQDDQTQFNQSPPDSIQ